MDPGARLTWWARSCSTASLRSLSGSEAVGALAEKSGDAAASRAKKAREQEVHSRLLRLDSMCQWVSVRVWSTSVGKPYFIKLMGFVCRRRYTVYPLPHQAFTWTQMCDIRDVKVVILAQDPYHRSMGSAWVFKDLLHLCPVWKTFIKSCLQTLMVMFLLVMEIYLGRPNKV